MPEYNLYKKSLFTILTLLSIAGWFSAAWCGHDNIACQICHHKTESELKGYTYDRSDFPISDLCLGCHDGSLDVSGLNPPHVINGDMRLAGGSFTPALYSDKVGHNINAVDQTLGLSPPGGIPLDELGCLSCHDSHENGNFRNLKKEINGYSTMVRADGDPEFQQNVYISGINNFCGACHENFNRRSQTNRVHPVGSRISGAQHADFNRWSGLANRITRAEYPSGNPNDLYGAQVFCLSCHRAHASAHKDAMRWDYSQSPQGCLECHSF